MTDLGLIPVWLLVIALATAVQAVVVIGAVIVLVGHARRLADTLEHIERDEIAPLVTRVHMTLDDMREIAGRARSADEDVRRVVSQATAQAARTAVVIRSRLWPAIGIARAVGAAVTSLTRQRHSHRPWGHNYAK